jgi:hypothetical protein
MPDLIFQMEKQKNTNWCWAAVSVSVAGFYNDQNWTQCKVVNEVLNAIVGGADCCASSGSPTPCNSGAPESCNIQWDLLDALKKVAHLARPPRGPLSFEEIRTQIQNQRPVACRISGTDQPSHFIIIFGYAQTASGQRWLTVADPGYSASEKITILYNDLLTNYDSRRWEASYLTK